MIGIENKDSSFFYVSSDDFRLKDSDMSKDLISLSVTERAGSMPEASLKFYDPDHTYSHLLRTGAEIEVAWGYKNREAVGGSSDSLSSDNITGDIERRGFKGFVSSPNGGGSANGVIIYNCNFVSYSQRGFERTETHRSGTKKSVIESVMTSIGILPQNQIVNFASGSDAVSEGYFVLQDETDYLFLTRRSREWRAFFTITYAKDGSPIGVFVDPAELDSLDLSILKGTSGSIHELGYKGKVNNVISYTWSSNESENGLGDDVRIEYIDGQPIFKRFVAESQSVITYQLDEDSVEAAYGDKAIEGPGAQTRWIQDMLSVQQFEEIEHFFKPVYSTTAPQGFGYRVKLNMVGNVLYSPPNRVSLVNGFPARLGDKRAVYYFNEVTHSISKSGYMVSAEVVDAYSFSDIGVDVY